MALIIKGKSGTEYSFNNYLWPVKFQYGEAVYLFTKLKEGLYYPIYVGITNDLSSRFYDHHKEDCIFKQNGATHLGILLESNEAKRKSIEKDILDLFNFPCNEVNN